MIYTSSVLKGYQATLSLLPLRLAFLCAQFWVLPIPEDDLKVFDLEDPTQLWISQIFVHFCCLLFTSLPLLNGHRKPMEMYNNFFQVLSVILMVVIFLWQFQTLLLMRNQDLYIFELLKEEVRTF